MEPVRNGVFYFWIFSTKLGTSIDGHEKVITWKFHWIRIHSSNLVGCGQSNCSFPTTLSTDLWTRLPVHVCSVPQLKVNLSWKSRSSVGVPQLQVRVFHTVIPRLSLRLHCTLLSKTPDWFPTEEHQWIIEWLWSRSCWLSLRAGTCPCLRYSKHIL
jgi:hypothetical protein